MPPPCRRHKKTGLGSSSRPGSHMSPACLAIYLTWLQAGRLKSPRDKSCSYSPPTFPSSQPSDKAVKGLILRHDPEKCVAVFRVRSCPNKAINDSSE